MNAVGDARRGSAASLSRRPAPTLSASLQPSPCPGVIFRETEIASSVTRRVLTAEKCATRRVQPRSRHFNLIHFFLFILHFVIKTFVNNELPRRCNQKALSS